MTSMRAKMYVNHVDRSIDGQETLYFCAVAASQYPDDGSDENNTYAKFTPNASLTLTVCNPALLGQFSDGDVYYLDFTKTA